MWLSRSVLNVLPQMTTGNLCASTVLMSEARMSWLQLATLTRALTSGLPGPGQGEEGRLGPLSVSVLRRAHHSPGQQDCKCEALTSPEEASEEEPRLQTDVLVQE